MFRSAARQKRPVYARTVRKRWRNWKQAKAEGTLLSTLVSCEDAVAFLPELVLDADRTVPTKNGLETNLCDTQEGLYARLCGGEFLGVGRIVNGAFQADDSPI